MLNLSIYKNFEDLEDSLTLDELTILVEGVQDNKYEDYRFRAALQGIDLDENKEGETTFEDIQARVATRARAEKEGKTVEEIEFAEFGIGIVKDEGEQQ
jgi:hypothetical protein